MKRRTFLGRRERISSSNIGGPKASTIGFPALAVELVRLERPCGGHDRGAAARSLGVELEVVEARSPKEFEPAFLERAQARTQALLILAPPCLRRRSMLRGQRERSADKRRDRDDGENLLTRRRRRCGLHGA